MQDLQFTVNPSSVDVSAPLIYLWEITDGAGTIVYRYVGKAKNGAARPLKHYRRNVRRLLADRPYRRSNPNGCRDVHQRLAEAIRAGHQVTLTFLCNIESDEDINAAEC